LDVISRFLSFALLSDTNASEISQTFEGRTASAVRFHYYALLKEKTQVFTPEQVLAI
jgi:hypothetical protein